MCLPRERTLRGRWIHNMTGSCDSGRRVWIFHYLIVSPDIWFPILRRRPKEEPDLRLDPRRTKDFHCRPGLRWPCPLPCSLHWHSHTCILLDVLTFPHLSCYGGSDSSCLVSSCRTDDSRRPSTGTVFLVQSWRTWLRWNIHEGPSFTRLTEG